MDAPACICVKKPSLSAFSCQAGGLLLRESAQCPEEDEKDSSLVKHEWDIIGVDSMA